MRTILIKGPKDRRGGYKNSVFIRREDGETVMISWGWIGRKK